MKKIKELFVQNKKEILLNTAALFGAVLIVVGVFLFWGERKVIWFCDELYSYFTANSAYAIGPRLDYGVWYDSQFVVDDMTPDQGRYFFRTRHNVRSDDHPPIYFLTMHFVSLLSNGSISKWVGLSINLICVIGVCIFAYLIFYFVTKRKVVSALAAIALCILPSMLTNAMLIRMYCMMTAWAVVFVFLSYLVLMKNDMTKRSRVFLYPALAVVTAMGFLTQYYFAIFAVGFTICATIYCICKKNWKIIGLYIASMVGAVGLATILWPDWITQLFYRYCGEEVFAQAANFSQIFKEIKFGLTCMPKLMFYDFDIVGMVLIVAGYIFLVWKKDEKLPIISFIIGGGLFYSLVVAHVTPAFYLDYRYFYMITGVTYIGVLLIFIRCLLYIPKEKIQNVGVLLGVVVIVVFNLATAAFNKDSIGYIDRSGEYNRKRAALEEYKELPWVVFGYENWTLMETYYDLALGSRFVVYSDAVPMVANKCAGEGEDYLLFLNNSMYSNEELLEFVQVYGGCEHEIEHLFDKCSSIYIVRHK